jgi:hypothetical protein
VDSCAGVFGICDPASLLVVHLFSNGRDERTVIGRYIGRS